MTEGIAELTISVVVCAYTERRWADLEAAIASVGAQSRPATETVLVIDHNPALAARARARFGRTGVRVVTNSRSRGLSGARNTALEHVAGDVVAFLDDDATADPHWLARLAAPYARVDVLAVGGPAHPVWPDGRRPGLLPAELYWVTGCSFTGQHAGTGLAEVRNLMGCNMSFRRSVFETIGGFDEGLGRLGDTPLGCEETELCIRLRQWFPDASILFQPLAMVDHRVGSERVTWAYLRRRCWAEGVSKAFVTATVGSGDGLSTERRYTTRVLPAAVRRELGAALHSLATGDLGGARRSVAGALAVPLALGAAAAGYLRGRAGTVGRGRRTTPGSR